MTKFPTIVAIALLAIVALAEPTEPGDKAANVLVFGGTGRMGSDIVKALVADGHQVSVLARASSDRARLEDLPVTFYVGDVLLADTVDSALASDQFDVVIDALGRDSAPVSFYRTSAEHIAAAAAKHGVTQIILHGSVGAGESARNTANGEQGSMSRLMAAKTDGEFAVISSGAAYTIIRNYRLLPYGRPDNGNAELYDDQTVRGPVTRAALARLTAGCVMNSDCFNKVFHAADIRKD